MRDKPSTIATVSNNTENDVIELFLYVHSSS